MSYPELSRAMKALASSCDGARDQDGVGFNGRDAGFGHVLASTPDAKWSPKMAAIAYKMATTYRGQLARHGIDLEKISPPDARDRRNGGKPAQRATCFDARIDGDLVVLSSAAFPGHQAVAAVKAMPGRRFAKTPKPHWTVPLAAAPDLIRAKTAGHVEMSDEVLARLRQVLSDRAAAAAESASTDAAIDVDGLGGELRPFQRAGVAYAAKHRRTFIADEMGLGKTVQALATLQATKSYPALIVAPASLKLNWRDEARKWLPMVRKIEVLTGRKPRPIEPGTGIVIINYDILSAWATTLCQWGPKAVVFDESHYLKSAKTQRTKAAKRIAGQVDGVRLLLSGTPIVNGPYDLISQLQILGRLRDLGGYPAFVGRYCIRGEWGGFERGGRNLQELNAKMRSGGMYARRLKKDVLQELPAKTRACVPVELKNRRRYDQAQARVARKIVAARIERATARREGRDPEGWAIAASVTGITELRKIAAECKLPGAIEWIKTTLESREKLVIFAHHIEVVERIAGELGCPSIRGGMKAEDRHAAVTQFQEDPDCRAIVLNLKAGGVGLTLTAASNVVFVESGWTPADNDQAEDRCHRIGQRDNVTAWYLIGDNTIDGWMHDLVAKKRETVDAATDGSEDAQRSIVSELADMLAESEAHNQITK